MGTLEEMSFSIQYGQYSLEGEEWEGGSEAAKDLIRKMLTVSLEDRVSAQEALSTPGSLRAPISPTLSELNMYSAFSPEEVPGGAKTEASIDFICFRALWTKEELKRQRELFRLWIRTTAAF